MDFRSLTHWRNGQLLQVLLAVVFVLWNNFLGSESAIGADMESTLKIGRAVCHPSKMNKMTAAEFFECYDYAPGKPEFIKCQQEIYGRDLSTVRGICNVCKNMGKFSQYATCLTQNFMATGLNLTDAVTKVNQCQAQVLGVV